MTADRLHVATGLVRLMLRTSAAALLVVYIAWNAFWLSQARVPPSLFLSLTGLPAPTTGGIRSLRQLSLGHWAESLRYNAMTVPICALLAYTVGHLAWQLFRRKRIDLPAWTVWGWAIVLFVAWALKLAGDPSRW